MTFPTQNLEDDAGELMMTPELELLLDEGLKNLEHAKATDELRHNDPGSN